MPKRRRRPAARVVKFCLALVALAFVVSLLPVVLLRFVAPPASAYMLIDRHAHRDDAAYRFAYTWTDWADIAPAAGAAVIAAEDQKFLQHSGFDFESISEALEERDRGRGLRGASTITQQVAKNLFLWPGRSWLRKGIEAWFTVLLELCWPKKRILEVYLNVAELGPGTFGVGAAAQRYFGKPAARLTAADSALLAAVLPNPKRLSVAAPSAYVRERQQWIERQMRQLGPVSAPNDAAR
jgi:monofunctional biosynthetic peptidoglycan transglycosylase